ncbi:MAG: PhzF family phenazine biosynthesis protein [Pseudomonadota bacterium]
MTTAPEPSGLTQCFSWPLGERSAAVRCFTATGKEINLCGHGLLCSASIWMQQWDGSGTLHMNGHNVICDSDCDTVWLLFQAPDVMPCEVPDWCEHVFGHRAIAAAISGSETDYLVLQWPPDCSLQRLPRPGKQLADHTQRAVIVTCPTQGAESAFADIHYRYFAPQYGVAEDSATGSALRILASYWAKLRCDGHLKAYQCSQEGGLLLSRLQGHRVWIGGRIARNAKESASFEREH